MPAPGAHPAIWPIRRVRAASLRRALGRACVVMLAAVAWLPMPATAADAPAPVTPEQRAAAFGRLPEMQELRLSPDGSRMVMIESHASRIDMLTRIGRFLAEHLAEPPPQAAGGGDDASEGLAAAPSS